MKVEHVKKEGKDYLFGDSPGAVILSRILYEQYPQDFRAVTKGVQNVERRLKKLMDLDADARHWLYPMVHKYIGEQFASVKNPRAASFARNILTASARESLLWDKL